MATHGAVNGADSDPGLDPDPDPFANPGLDPDPGLDPVAVSVAVYSDGADDYSATHAPKMTDRVERFAGWLPRPSLILDAGCGLVGIWPGSVRTAMWCAGSTSTRCS